MNSNEKFSKEALEHLSSPDQLDHLMQIHSPASWAGLGGFCLIMLTGILWGIYGHIYQTVTGQGMLILPGGIPEVVSQRSGQIESITVETGQKIEKGQLVATLSQSHILLELGHAQENLSQATKEYDLVYLWIDQKPNLRTFLKDQSALPKGLTDETYRMFQSLKQLEQRKLTAQHTIELLEKKLDETQIKSPMTGTVVEIDVRPGSLVERGQTILQLEPFHADARLQAVIYISPAEGKRVQRNMIINVTPDVVRKAEYGSIEGWVTEISQYPVTSASIERELGNPLLVDQFTRNGAPIAIHVALKQNSDTFSGYQWTSSQGPDFYIAAGTPCKASVQVEEQRPITLIIPFLKETLGLVDD